MLGGAGAAGAALLASRGLAGAAAARQTPVAEASPAADTAISGEVRYLVAASGPNEAAAI